MQRPRITRRHVVHAGTLAALGAPWIRDAAAQDVVKIGLVDPFSGVYAALGRNEEEGCRMALGEVNAAGGITGRKVELLSEDSAAKTDVGVQKLRKLIERDKVNFTLGDVSSGVSLALSQTANEFGIPHIVTGGHADAITGKDCKWNTFRIPTNGNMEARAIGAFLADKFGKDWFIITPDYAYGWSLQEAFSAVNKKLGGRILGAERVPLGTNDYSASLLKAGAAKPKVLLVFQAGTDAVAILTQIVQFGLDKQMAVAGGLQEWENVAALPPQARIGWWTFEWYYEQPDVPEVKRWVDAFRKAYNHTPTARNWFGYVALHSLALAANQAKSLEASKVVRAMQGLQLPKHIALQPHAVSYRAGDHQLLTGVWVGEVRQGKDKDDLFHTAKVVSGAEAVIPVEETGCKFTVPG